MQLRARGLLMLAALGLAGWSARPPALVGMWQLRQISFVVGRPISHELQEELDDSIIGALNTRLRQGQARVVVSFRADGTYQLAHYEKVAVPTQTETGTYRLVGQTLVGEAPATPSGSTFAQSRVRKLTARQLVLNSPVGPDSLRIFKQQEYTRLPAGSE